MTLHPIAIIDEEPEESIYSWSIHELQTSYEPQRTRHLVGYIPYLGEGRVTSAIQVFDKESRRIVTKSGRMNLIKDCMCGYQIMFGPVRQKRLWLTR